MAHELDQDSFRELSKSRYFNIHLKSGGLYNQVTIRSFEGLKPADIEWVWIWDIRRRATAKEIQLLCETRRNEHEGGQ